ncbi:acetyl-CoA carboxylase biotin carboxylase subunit family protein [Larkinella insperata]|uniref:Acetyl-CoA carboxylase biotin carboxylase subunit family protein n=1 Tax=Larkinella insperata TaxID=332158 RepID=A0ABW3Q5S5_9BACT|nr:ATPase [Larkinella insperata]
MSQLSFLCISTYFKGEAFLKACKEAGNTVYLLTYEKLADQPWPREAVDEFFYLPSQDNSSQNLDILITGLAHTMRSRKIDRVVALDDFDVEKAALVRETFRIPGMGQTTARFFRDKLAMRMRAAADGIRVPAFSSLFHDETVTEFLRSTEAPWLIKPRSEASATGIKKVHSLDEAWQVIHSLGDRRHQFLIEQFKPGRVFHVDSLSQDGTILFTRASQYLATPMDVAHGGGVFRTAVLPFDSDEARRLHDLNEAVLNAFRMQSSASHSEFILGDHDGEFYFLETSSRVGGANIAELVEASSGINLWREWARLESAIARNEPYQLPAVQNQYAGLIISLARQQWPNTDGFTDKEIVWRMNREYHVGFIVKAPERERVLQLLDAYMERIYQEYHASAPVPDRPTN